jgi:hypothetical protein
MGPFKNCLFGECLPIEPMSNGCMFGFHCAFSEMNNGCARGEDIRFTTSWGGFMRVRNSQFTDCQCTGSGKCGGAICLKVDEHHVVRCCGTKTIADYGMFVAASRNSTQDHLELTCWNCKGT